MAITNQERVGKAMDLLRDGLRPFAERELKAKHGDRWPSEVRAALSGRPLGQNKGDLLQDVAVLLAVMDKAWGAVFSAILGRADRNLVLELIDVRNRWAHQEPFSSDDSDRALDSMTRLLTSVSATPQADEVGRMKMELRRLTYDEQVRAEKRKAGGSLIDPAAIGTLKPWREIVTPHTDVASGRYQQAEFAAAGVKGLPQVKCVVLVGNKISPGNPVTKPDGTVVRTLWGELAYQLGGKKAFARVKADDERATNPGDVLRELFKEYGPCLVLIDEWVAYARQLHDQGDLPAGGFETQFTFAQALTESAKLAGNCLLVISLPASDTSGSPHTQSDDVEVGGIRGREALDRLRNVVGRVESSWRPATAEEGFEIVRRRLFEPLAGPDAFKQRDVTARAFADLYHAQSAEFPPECRGGDYEKRIQAAYPIHPEIFDRLYSDWSTLVKFQRTRGVLRLMAAVIHSLWEKGDRNPLVLPSTVPIDGARVQSELTRYLSDNWAPIIEKDVDGPTSLPLKIDADQPNLGKLHATRRVARTIYLGSAPTVAAAHRGLEDRRGKLGCGMPGESPAVFGDALRRLAGAATYLYQDGPRFWYATQPTVTKLAEDRAEQLRRDPDKVVHELDQRLRKDLERKGEFSRIHPMPQSGQDVPDDLDARLVVLGVDHPYSKETGSAADTAAKAMLEQRGNT